MPEGVEFLVTPVTPYSSGYNYGAYMRALNNSAAEGVEYTDDNTMLYDMAFVAVDDDGKLVEVQPEKGTVNVEVVFKQQQLSEGLGAEESAEVEVAHLPLVDGAKADTTAESTNVAANDVIVDAVNANVSVQRETVSFVARDFSVYAFYTVDFTYDGYMFKMNGEDSVLLSELFASLGISEDAAEAVDVTFTNYDYISVARVVDDWLLTSLQSFTTEETLTVIMSNGTKYLITVTDPQTDEGNSSPVLRADGQGDGSSGLHPDGQGNIDITGTLSEVTITIDGEPVSANGTIEVVAGQQYEIGFLFAETNDWQFSDDNTPMTYHLPAGMSFVNTSGTFEMDFGTLGKLENNTFEIRDGILYVNWNTEDTIHMNVLRAADNAFFSFSTTGQFNSDSTHIEWADEIETEVTVTEPHDANIAKSGTYNKDTDKIEYTLTVTSEGRTTGIKVTDTITGTALTSDVHSINDITVKKNGTKITLDANALTVNGNTFTLSLPDMADDDVYTIEYTASVDYTELSGNGKTSITETYNGVKLDWDENGDNPPKEDSNYEYEINYSSLDKEATEIGDEITDPVTGEKYRIITWKITANEQRKVPVTHIKDSIGAASRSIMKMDGAGITVTVTKEDGTTETRTLTWGQSDATNGALSQNDLYSWTYYPPETDGKAKYEITYTTKVDTTDVHIVTAVDNDVEHDYDNDHGSEGIGPDEDSEVTLAKEVTEVTDDYVIWDIYATIPAEGLSDFKLIEGLPNLPALGVYDYWDKTFGDPENPGVKVISGLVEGETVSAAVSQYVNKYSETGEQIRWESEVTISFFKDGQPGVKGTGASRTVHLQIKTLNNTDWLDFVA